MSWSPAIYEESFFDFQQGQESFPCLELPDQIGAHLASYSVGTWGDFPGGKDAAA
jgi:hypothetical protein